MASLQPHGNLWRQGHYRMRMLRPTPYGLEIKPGSACSHFYDLPPLPGGMGEVQCVELHILEIKAFPCIGQRFDPSTPCRTR